MTDPYSVLGIPRDSSDDEIKKAYRSLSRKYHPDANINNPDKDQAEARFKEVQQAYEQIIREREYGSSDEYAQGGFNGSGDFGGFGSFGGFGPFGGFGTFGGGSFHGQNAEYRQQSSSGATDNEDELHMRAAFNFINSRHYQEALNLLNNIQDHSALWYYYSSLANSGLGNNVLALQHAKEALRLEPDNLQYQMLVNRFENGGNWYRQQQGPYQTTFVGGGNFCMKLCIANIVCNLCCSGGMCCGTPGYYI